MAVGRDQACMPEVIPRDPLWMVASRLVKSLCRQRQRFSRQLIDTVSQVPPILPDANIEEPGDLRSGER